MTHAGRTLVLAIQTTNSQMQGMCITILDNDEYEALGFARF